jgi:3-oxoacyl-[acyl-carrier protein] reductase
MRLEKKVAIVTGGGSGFGEGISKRFAAEGCQVIVNDINVDGGERVVSEIKSAGGQAAFVKGNVAVDADWANLLKETIDQFGHLDILSTTQGRHIATNP